MTLTEVIQKIKDDKAATDLLVEQYMERSLDPNKTPAERVPCLNHVTDVQARSLALSFVLDLLEDVTEC